MPIVFADDKIIAIKKYNFIEIVCASVSICHLRGCLGHGLVAILLINLQTGRAVPVVARVAFEVNVYYSNNENTSRH